MPFDGNGVYNPLSPPVFPAVPGETILAAYYNQQIDDIADALSNCLTRDGQGDPTANISMNSFKLTGLGTAADPADAVRFDQIVKPGLGDTLNNNVYLKAKKVDGTVINLIGIDASDRIVLGRDNAGNFWARYNLSSGVLELSSTAAMNLVSAALLTLQGTSTRNVGALNATGDITAFAP